MSHLISNELSLIRYGNGVKLINPESQDDYKNNIKTILNLPFNVFFLNTESIVQSMNEETAATMGWSSVKYSLKKSAFHVLTRSAASRIIRNDNLVIMNNNIKIMEEHVTRKDDVDVIRLSVRSPWYNDQGKIIGLMGCAIIVGKHHLASSLESIMELGLLNKQVSNNHKDPVLGKYIGQTYLSRREVEILTFMSRGYSAKKTAIHLSISCRTVEKHIENIKFKLKVHSKSHLIDLFYQAN